MTLLDQVRATIARYGMLTADTRVGVAVSGGADSICLLHVLLELGYRLDVLHVDHNLRGAASHADAEFVRDLAERLHLPFHVRTLDLDLQRGNLEQNARRARYAFFAELTGEGGVERVALGHTRTDQAETVLYRLLRGAGSAGLSGIRPVTDSGLIRPLLQVTRPQVVSWLRERNIRWREDSTNSDLRFDRNRLRHQTIPTLEAEWNPAIQEILAQTADWAYEEEQFWRSELAQLTEGWVRCAEGAVVVDTRRLTSLAIAVQRRVIREVVRQVKHDVLGVDFAHTEAIRTLAASDRGAGTVQIAGLEVTRSFEWLRFAIPAEAHSDWEIAIPGPGRYRAPRGFVNPIDISLLSNNDVYNRDVNALDLEKAGDLAGGALVLRNCRPGDKYQRVGHAGTESLKNLFQEFRIPSWDRADWPVLTVGGSIAWVNEFGPAASFAADAASRTVLRIRQL